MILLAAFLCSPARPGAEAPGEPDLERPRQPPFEPCVRLTARDEIRHHRAHAGALLERLDHQAREPRAEEARLEARCARQLGADLIPHAFAVPPPRIGVV